MTPFEVIFICTWSSSLLLTLVFSVGNSKYSELTKKLGVANYLFLSFMLACIPFINTYIAFNSVYYRLVTRKQKEDNK